MWRTLPTTPTTSLGTRSPQIENPLTQRAPRAEGAPGRELVDDRHRWATLEVTGLEEPSAPERDAERLEVSRAGEPQVAGEGGVLLAGQREVTDGVGGRERKPRDEPGRGDLWLCREGAEHVERESRLRRRRGMPEPRERQVHRQHPTTAEAGIDRLRGPVAPEEEPGPEQEQQRQPDLEAEEHRPETASGPALGAGPPPSWISSVVRTGWRPARTASDTAVARTPSRASPSTRNESAGSGSPDACGLAATRSGAAQAASPTATVPARSAISHASRRKRSHSERRLAPSATRTASSWVRRVRRMRNRWAALTQADAGQEHRDRQEHRDLGPHRPEELLAEGGERRPGHLSLLVRKLARQPRLEGGQRRRRRPAAPARSQPGDDGEEVPGTVRLRIDGVRGVLGDAPLAPRPRAARTTEAGTPPAAPRPPAPALRRARAFVRATPGSAPKRRRHICSESTATRGPGGPGSMRRPRSGRAPSTWKKSAETSAPSTRSGSPSVWRLNPRALTAASASKGSASAFQARKSAPVTVRRVPRASDCQAKTSRSSPA